MRVIALVCVVVAGSACASEPQADNRRPIEQVLSEGKAKPAFDPSTAKPLAGPWNQYKSPPPPPGYKVVNPDREPVPPPPPPCPDGQHRTHGIGKCIKSFEHVVERSWFGWCPSGYVDHPYEPALCVTPIYAARAMRRTR